MRLLQYAAMVVVGAGIALPATDVSGQSDPLRVALSVTDPSNRVYSAFASALRGLGDVEVVSGREEHDFQISVVAVCDQDEGCDSYAIATSVSAPIKTEDVLVPIYQVETVEVATRDGHHPYEHLEEDRRFQRALRQMEVNHGLWVFSWGANVYEEAAREFVRELDGKCFQRRREELRAANAYMRGDTVATRRISAGIQEEDWLC